MAQSRRSDANRSLDRSRVIAELDATAVDGGATAAEGGATAAEGGATAADGGASAPAVSPHGDVISEEELHSAGLRGLRWTAISRPTIEFVLFASMLVLARLVSPAEFGRYAVALVFAELMLIPGQAVGSAFVQSRQTGPRYEQSAAALAVVMGAALVAFTLLMAKFFVVPVFDERTANLVRLSAVGCALNSLCLVPTAVLHRRLEFKQLSINDLINNMTRVAASLALAAIGWQAMGLMIGGLIGAAVSTVQLCILSRPPRPRFHREETRALTRYGYPAAAGAVSWVGFRNCDYAIIGARLGARPAGFYFRAYMLGVDYQSKISVVLDIVGFPLLARSHPGEGQRELRRRMVRLLTVVVFPALALLAVESPVLIPWLFGPRWTPVVGPTQALVVGGAVTLCINAVGSELMAAGRAHAVAGYGWAHFIVYGSTVFFVSRLGIFWVAVSASVVHSVFLIVAYVLVRERSGIAWWRPFVDACREIWIDTGAALVSCVALVVVGLTVAHVMTAIHAPAVAHIAAVSLASLAAYVLALRLLFPDVSRTMLSLLRRLLPKRPAVLASLATSADA